MNTSEPNQDGELTGRALDAAIAERVMEWERVPVKSVLTEFQYRTPDHIGLIWPSNAPRYSSSIADAMKVLPALRKRLALSDSIVFWCKPSSFIVQIWADDADDTELANVLADTLPEAICRAALAAVKKD